MNQQRYCLDANVLITAWQGYYSPEICKSYWDTLKGLGDKGLLFIAEEVFDEILKTEDELSKWVKAGNLPVEKTDSSVIQCLKTIYSTNPVHEKLVDSTRNRSLADPWVIAHAMRHNACVVTKEAKITTSPSKVKIPNVCENMGVRWIDDFKFGREINLKFTCSI